MSDTVKENAEAAQWRRVPEGDREAFRALVEPLAGPLLQAAAHDIAEQQSLGTLVPDDLAAEDLVGETLIRAWSGRRHRPCGVSLRAWLRATQQRVLERIVAGETALRERWSVSLEAPPPPEPQVNDDGESFWQWHQPDDFVRLEDEIVDDSPTPEELVTLEEIDIGGLDPQAQRVLRLRAAHRLGVAEIAYILRLPVERTRELLESIPKSGNPRS